MKEKANRLWAAIPEQPGEIDAAPPPILPPDPFDRTAILLSHGWQCLPSPVKSKKTKRK
jgi:hypothetical protein